MSLVRAALILGLLSAVGPFAIDMYLPAMPAIAADLGTDPAAVQATLIAYFVAFGAAQMVYGPQATKLMALVMFVISASPILAPLAGSGLMELGGWRAIFWVLAIAAVAGLALTSLTLPETLAPGARTRIDVTQLKRDVGVLLRDPVFMGLVRPHFQRHRHTHARRYRRLRAVLAWGGAANPPSSRSRPKSGLNLAKESPWTPLSQKTAPCR